MTTHDVRRLALVLSVQAEIESMEMSNKAREGYTNYYACHFKDKSDELKRLAQYTDADLERLYFNKINLE